jgi:hypothetical protein
LFLQRFTDEAKNAKAALASDGAALTTDDIDFGSDEDGDDGEAEDGDEEGEEEGGDGSGAEDDFEDLEGSPKDE